MSNMVIATNVLALNSHRQLKGVGGDLSKSSEKLSSGYRINRAADDAAGLAISEKMRSQIRGLDQASRNSQDGISLIQTAEGALQETQDMLQRMRELTVQAANETLTQSDRDKIALELDELSDEIDSTAQKTEFNTKKLIDGSLKSQSLYLQTGANQNQGLSFTIEQMDSKVLGVTKGAIGDAVRGSEGLRTGATGTEVVFTNIAVSAFTDHVGTYNFGDGKAMTINSDGTLTVTGEFKQADGVVLKEGTHDLKALGALSFEIANGPNGETSKVDITSTSIKFTTAEAANDDVFEVSDTDVGNKTVFDNGMIMTAKGDGAATPAVIGFTFTNVDGAKIYDSNGNAISIEEGKTYSLAELKDMKVMSGDGQMITMDSDGLIADQKSQYTNTIKFTDGLDADGKATSVGAQISKLTDIIDSALEKVSSQRAKLGAYQNRLEHTIKNLDTSAENLTASESRIRDTDMAKEMMNLTKKNVLQQAATSMLAQANQAPQNILKLLG